MIELQIWYLSLRRLLVPRCGNRSLKRLEQKIPLDGRHVLVKKGGPLEGKEMNTVEPNTTEDRRKVRCKEIRLARMISREDAARCDANENGAVLKQPDLAGWRHPECSAYPHDLIDPGFQNRWHGKVVHRRSDHEKIRRLKFYDQLF
jgi:hypothetical protein